METIKKQKVEAIKVNDFEVEKDRGGFIYDDVKTTVSIKVNNTVIPIVLRYGTDYKTKERTVTISNTEEEKLNDFITIDYSKIIHQYEAFAKETIALREEEKKQQDIKRYNENSFVKYAKVNKFVKGFSISLNYTLEQYLKNESWNKSIELIVGGNSWNFVSFDDKKFKTEVSKHKRATHTELYKAVDRIVKCLQENIEEEKAMKAAEKEKDEKVKSIKEILSQFGKIEIEERGMLVGYGRHRHYRIYDKFYLKVGERKISMSVNMLNEEETFNLDGIYALTAKQVKQILNIIK